MDYQLQSVKDISVEKGRNGVKRIVFGRVGVLMTCLLVQLLLLFIGMTYLARYIYLFFGGYLAFGLLILFFIVNRTMNPGIQLSWAAIVLMFPVFGGLLYLYVEIQPGTHMLKGALDNIDNKLAGILHQDEDVLERLDAKNANTAQLASYIYNEENFPVYKNTGVRYFPSGEAKFAELLRQLKLAEKFIFMEYFIVSMGFMWDSIFEILKAKVAEGVEVRFMYDGMNDLYNVPGNFQDMLRRAGIQCKVFSPVYPIISTHYNNRDHRKIVVIDGRTAFTGGVNIADEYINQKERFGHWKDAAIMVQGDAVRSFTIMFLKMWNVAGKLENVTPYLNFSNDVNHVQRGMNAEGTVPGTVRGRDRTAAGQRKEPGSLERMATADRQGKISGGPKRAATTDSREKESGNPERVTEANVQEKISGGPENGMTVNERKEKKILQTSAAREDVSYEKEETALAENCGFVLPYATNPFHSEHIAKRIYLDILNHAKRYVYIMTPYLVPDYELLQALTYAARRKVDVKLLMPHIPDKKYAFALGHSYYRYLLQAGVHIYEYTPGFVHSKIFVSDDTEAVVGAINLDYRSLYLNFESAVFMYGVPAVLDIKVDFLQTLRKCQLITDFDIRHDKITRKLVGGVLKLFAPLL